MTSILKETITTCSKTSYVTLFWLLLLRLIPDVIPKDALLDWVSESLQKHIVNPAVIEAVKDRFGEEVMHEPLQSVIRSYQDIYSVTERVEEEKEQGMDDRFLDALHCEEGRKRGGSLSSDSRNTKRRCIPQIEPKLDIGSPREHDLLINMVLTTSDYKKASVAKALPERLNPLCFIQLCFLSPSTFLQNYRPFLYPYFERIDLIEIYIPFYYYVLIHLIHWIRFYFYSKGVTLC